MAYILAADIGGTHCRFARFEAAPDGRAQPLPRLIQERWLPSAEYASFPDALAALKQKGADGSPALVGPAYPVPDVAAFASAGPVQRGECRLSNLNWIVRAEDIRQALGAAQVHLINDFVAQAYACLIPENIDAVSILPGQVDPDAPVAVIGAGTGFGSALLLKNAFQESPGQQFSPKPIPYRFSRAKALSCEGGHALFPFVGEEEHRFASFAAEREGTDRLIGDHIVTGKGIAHIFAFHTGRDLPPREATEQAREHEKVMEYFARFYARAARNFVLSTLALGGLYITGGMALRLPVLSHPAFADELHNSGSQRRLMESLPVWHIRKAHSGLWGAALHGLLRFTEKED